MENLPERPSRTAETEVLSSSESINSLQAAPEGGPLVPVTPADVVPIERLEPAKRRRARELMAKIDLNDTQAIIAFGVEAQREVTASADRMLEGVRNKDTGPVGDALSSLMLNVRGLGVDDLKPGDGPGWFQRVVLRQIHPIAKFVQRYESVDGQVDSIVAKLEQHKARLLRDVTMLDKMYAASLEYLDSLEVYIAAAAAKLAELDSTTLPAIRANAEQTGDLLDAQNLRDAIARRDDLERRLHDLRLTRQVTMQSLPQIRLIQDVDKSLLTKIQSSVLTTIPVWKAQIAMAITLWNQHQALKIQKAVTDTTNEMLERNAELLRMGTAEARKEIERGIFDVETIQKVNDQLIATIQESIQIAQDAKVRRAASETQMQQMEADLKRSLADARGAI